MKQQPKQANSRGFAIIATISLMVLLLILALGMLSLATVELRSSGSKDGLQVARSNARMGMMIALGELQEAAGPDQRITATASIMGQSGNAYTSSIAPVDGRRHWTGVWRSDTVAVGSSSPSYDPLDPDEKVFEGWLVSSGDAAPKTTAERAAALELVEDPVEDSEVTIFEGETDEGDVIVPLVTLSEGTTKVGSYAYWVEDQGVKADLSWNEVVSGDDELEQVNRLNTVLGPDYGVFEGPFTSTTVSYPIKTGATNSWLENMEKAVSTADMRLVMDDATDQSDWLRENRHDIALGSYGVIADVKNGGLRADLSLAFEMDGEADANSTDRPTKFNQQQGVFVGSNSGNETKDATQAIPGQGIKGRLVYRHSAASSPYSSYFTSFDSILRGPTWWALRDYANLYKRLASNGSAYSLPARAQYPNRSAGITPIAAYLAARSTTVGGQALNRETLSGNYFYRPSSGNYAPAYLGMTCLVGTKVLGDKLTVTLDPIFHLWNPYNVNLQFDSFAVFVGNQSLPAAVNFWIDDDGSGPNPETKYGPTALREMIRNSYYLLKSTDSSPISMEPGEVMVFSANEVIDATSNTSHGSATPGYFLNGFNETGIIRSGFPGGAANVTLTDSHRIGFSLQRDGGGRLNYSTSLPDSGVTPAGLVSSPGETLQGLMNITTTVSSGGWSEYANDAADLNSVNQKSVTNDGSTNSTETPSSLTDKRFFGILTFMVKPSYDEATPADGSTYQPNPFQVFARHNPLFYLSSNDVWHSVAPNMLYSVVTDGDPQNLINGYSANLSSSPRNAYWGGSFNSTTGSTAVPMLSIPTAPLHSLAQFSDGSFSMTTMEPMRGVGNSWSSFVVSPEAPIGSFIHAQGPSGEHDGMDFSWLMNDELFDSYYLSGVAPAFTNNGSYQQTISGTEAAISDTLTNFFNADYQEAAVNPVLRPHIPQGESVEDIVDTLADSEGYSKLGAYSLVKGLFNVNSTSLSAWESYLRANRDLAVTYAQGAVSDSPSSDTPFPRAALPANPTALDVKEYWSGFARLSDGDITELATQIVDQVKLRGPFMSISDFVNHRLGTVDAATSYTGALQAAIDLAGINQAVEQDVSGTIADYSSGYFANAQLPANQRTTADIPGYISQVDLLRPLAPRLSARSDTFRIRSYGEALSETTGAVTAKAVCEVVVQRLPAFVDAETDPTNNQPWSEIDSLNTTNLLLGRRFKVVQFRWLSLEEL